MYAALEHAGLSSLFYLYLMVHGLLIQVPLIRLFIFLIFQIHHHNRIAAPRLDNRTKGLSQAWQATTRVLLEFRRADNRASARWPLHAVEESLSGVDSLLKLVSADLAHVDGRLCGVL